MPVLATETISSTKDTLMIFISDACWLDTQDDAVVLPCDCSGIINRGLVLEAVMKWGNGPGTRYSQLSRDGLLMNFQEIFWQRSYLPKFMCFFPVAHHRNDRPTRRLFWDALIRLKSWTQQNPAVHSITFPLAFTTDIPEEDQIEMIHECFWEYEHLQNRTLNIYMLDETAPYDMEVCELVTA
jgi:hypothetical protein